VLVVAAGVPALITGEDVRDGVIVIDVGINPVKDPSSGKVRLVGDVEADSVAARAEALSPVPGGVGPVTDVWLVHNTVVAARAAAQVDLPDLPLARLGTSVGTRPPGVLGG
jgi:methylenetetrahydrofolate dehydrogenase (NADP+)/methenyltetrahydrofolate cyclohydrolase